MSRFEWFHCDYCGFGAAAEMGHRPAGWTTLYVAAYVAKDHVPEGPMGLLDVCPSCRALIKVPIELKLNSPHLHYVDFTNEVFRSLFSGSPSADEKGSGR